MQLPAIRQLWRPVVSSTIGHHACFSTYGYRYGRAPSSAEGPARSPVDSTVLPVVRFDDTFCQRVRDEFSRENDASAIRLQTFPKVARLIKGFRGGELTVFTGPTGSGKTTVLSQMSLDYCFQGVRTLWGSFEIRNTRLARIMIQQVAAQSLFANDTEDDEQADSRPGSFNEETFHQAQRILRQSPIFFMDYFGSTPLEAVLDTMERAITGHQIQHVILDNLQFMLSGQHSGSLDKFDVTDRTVAALRAFATTRNVHVTLVIHPRKELDDTPLGLASVSGTAKATQEADNVIILQKVGETRYIDVKKNRFDGALGSVPIKFNAKSRLVAEADVPRAPSSQ